ncbi:MAG: hypothetical protein WA125_09085 [Desulfosporosinus sp.]
MNILVAVLLLILGIISAQFIEMPERVKLNTEEHKPMSSAVVGFSFGTLFAVSAPLITDFFGLKHFGAIYGLVFTAYGFISGILGPSLSGYLIDMNKGNFTPVFTYLGVFCLLSGVLIRFAVPAVQIQKRQL